MVEGTALEMRHTGNRIEGSNPSLSATYAINILTSLHNLYRFCLNPKIRPNTTFTETKSGCSAEYIPPDMPLWISVIETIDV